MRPVDSTGRIWYTAVMYAYLKTILFSPYLDWTVVAIFAGAAIAACVAYYRPISERKRTRFYMRLAIGAILFRFVLACFKVWLQYQAWLESDMSKYLLPPYRGISYLLRYGWTHFMLNAVISVGVALLFFVVLRVLQRYNGRWFNVGEVELGFLLALIVGWPGFLAFVPVAFLSVVFISIIRGIFLKEPYTTLGLPFFIATAFAFAFAPAIVVALKLTPFSI